MTFFNIVIPFYNTEKWLPRCLKTIKAQDYDNYRVVLVNDCSTDNSKSVVEKEINKNDKFSLVSTPANGVALSSIKFGIEAANLGDEDVIVVLDGDDWLARYDVLTVLDRTYSGNDCLMTYGSYVEYPSSVRGKFARELPRDVIEKKRFRTWWWCTSHLKTFKYKLWKNIKYEDMLDGDGKIYSMAGDLCMMYPMLEMAEERSFFIKDILYVRNGANPINEDKVDHKLQFAIEQRLRASDVYPRLEDI